jgi:hypothetical protein
MVHPSLGAANPDAKPTEVHIHMFRNHVSTAKIKAALMGLTILAMALAGSAGSTWH